jgi:Kinesin motor domain
MESKQRNSNVKVAIRIRPALRREYATTENNELKMCVAVPRGVNNKIMISKNEKPLLLNNVNGGVESGIDQFSFDRVFWVDASQGQVYDEMAKDMIRDVFQGFNSTIFAYGKAPFFWFGHFWDFFWEKVKLVVAKPTQSLGRELQMKLGLPSGP